jgi:hypothetical protein
MLVLPVRVGALICSLALIAHAHPRHGINVQIGRSASGQLKARFDFAAMTPLMLLPPGDLFAGWAGDGPGFETLLRDDPVEGLLALPLDAPIRLEVARADPAFAAVDGATLELLDQPGESKFLGAMPFETHVLWLINSADPAFDADQMFWSIDLRFIDERGILAPSDVATLSFTNVPEPATFGLSVAAIGLAAWKRPPRARPRPRS